MIGMYSTLVTCIYFLPAFKATNTGLWSGTVVKLAVAVSISKVSV